jgi:Zn-dependent peptidase ImmA (M78 family)
MNYEQLYRGALAKQAEERRLRRHLAWLQQFPLHAMARRGWIQPCEDGVQQIRELLNFFGIASPERWYETWSSPEVAYRRSRAFRSTPGALSAWLRAGELEGQQIRTAAYSGARFRDVLAQVRRMTVQHQREVFDNVARICSEAGVAVAFIKEVKGAPVSGATRWVTPDKALILLTIRYKTDDQLWFSFFHEAGHVLLHGKREVFIEEDGNDDPRELQANSFARDVLIPPTAFRRLVSMAKKPSRNMVVSFASQTGIAPGIVVGRLQHEGLLPFSHLNDLKHRLRWSEE